MTEGNRARMAVLVQPVSLPLPHSEVQKNLADDDGVYGGSSVTHSHPPPGDFKDCPRSGPPPRNSSPSSTSSTPRLSSRSAPSSLFFLDVDPGPASAKKVPEVLLKCDGRGATSPIKRGLMKRDIFHCPLFLVHAGQEGTGARISSFSFDVRKASSSFLLAFSTLEIPFLPEILSLMRPLPLLRPPKDVLLAS